MRRFEFVEGSSSKFWEIEQDGSDLNIRWGRIGTQGQAQTKSFADDAKATAAMKALVEQKTGKGYVESTAVAGAAIGKIEAKPKSPSAPTPASTKESPAVSAAPPPSAPAEVATKQSTNVPTGDPSVAPWLAGGEPFDIPAAVLAKALPSRRFPAKVDARDDFEMVVARLREAVKEECTPDESGSDASMRGALQTGWQRLHQPTAKAAPQADTALMALVFSAIANRYGSVVDLGPFVDCLVNRYGLPGAVDLLLQAEREFEVQSVWRGGVSNKRGLRFLETVDGPLSARWGCPVGSGEWEFRRHLSSAGESDYRQCVQRIRTALPSLHPARRVVMAMLLPDEPEISNELALALGGPNGTPAVQFLQLTATDPAAVASARRVKADSYASHPLDDQVLVATLLQERGMQALPVLLSRAEGEVAGTALAAFGVPEAIDALARVASTSKGALARLTAAVNRWPLAAIVALSKLVAGGSKEGALVAPSLAGLLRAHAEALPALRPWLGSAAENVVDKMMKQLSGPGEVAEAEALPTVLARPPWLAVRKKAAVSSVAGLEPLPLAAIERWNPGERDAALNLTPWEIDRFSKAQADPLQMAAELGFSYYDRKKHPLQDAAAEAIRQRDAAGLVELWHRMRRSIKLERNYSWNLLNAAAFAHLPEAMAVEAWNALAGEGESDGRVSYIAAKFGLRVLPGLQTVFKRRPSEELVLALNFGVVDFAPQMARAFARLKTLRDTAREWLLRFPEHAACGLIAPAIGKAGEARDCAGVALRMLASSGHEALLLEVAGRYQDPAVVAALAAVLAEDPLDRFPAKRPALPAFWQPRAWRRPVLSGGPGEGKALPDDALDAIGTMLAFPVSEGLYPGIEQVREACTRDSLADFTWDCFAAWLYAGAPSKESWALSALGLFGNDDIARKLTPYIRAWPGEAAHARAVAGLDVLAAIGSDVALMLLNGVAQKVKFKGLQDRAREKIAQIAEDRGFTTEELEDRLAPDLGLDENGTMLLDFGARSFRVGFDEALKPFVRDADGARLADLPKPKKTDDAQLSKEATERFKLLKKDARTIASQQVLRLEVAMCSRRRWSPEVFRAFLAEHPLVRHLVQRLVWGVYDVKFGEGSYGGKLVACFRVAEDGSLTDGQDEPFEIPDGARMAIGIPHALELAPDAAAAFSQLFTDYELLQPFVQLGRDTYVLTTAEREQTKLERWKGAKVPTGRVLGLVNKGWRRGQAQDGGGIWYFSKPLGAEKVIELSFEPGIIVGMVDENPEQTLQEVQVGKASSWGDMQNGEVLANLDAISASELIRDLESLRA